MRRRMVLFGTLLLAALIGLTGCPDDGGDGGPTTNPIDSDGDLLIDISFLEDLNNVRFNLAGTTYKTSEGDSGMQCGDAGTTACTGYELLRSLDFNDPDSYSSGAVNENWRPEGDDPTTATNVGWEPIGENFSATFEGNGNTISNLYVRRSGNLGLFGVTASAVISNIGVINGMVYGESGGDIIGVLVGNASNSTIAASYASGGTANGVVGNDNIGGLVGQNSNSDIVASYATVAVDGGAGGDRVGGLVGEHNDGGIIASYATGSVDGGAGSFDNVGGLVGYQTGSISNVTASYATGSVDGGVDTSDTGGALMARQVLVGTTPVTVSYGFGTVDNSETDGISPRPSGVASANALTLATAGAQWNDENEDTLGAWDFRTTSEPPVLLYADYDGSGTDYACATADNPPAGAILIAGENCGTSTASPLPNQP